jgi:methylglutaconyl-CoA hydratase
LREAINDSSADDSVLAVILRSNGKNFSAGADLRMMKSSVNSSRDENYSGSLNMGRMFHALNNMPKPVIALVQGSAFGGALGLIACCDIAIASQDASFCLSEVKIGLAPAVISPFVVSVMGERASRRYFLTAEKINASKAVELGLIHELVNREESFDEILQPILKNILSNAPGAISKSKELIKNVSRATIDDELLNYTAGIISDLRITNEGQEGLSAFLEKRKPNWIKG